MQLEIFSPEAQLFNGEVESITLPGALGSFQILNNHAPIISKLVSGKVKIRGDFSVDKEVQSRFTREGDFFFLDINSGAVELIDNKVYLLID